jgi:hypothetical protein
VSGTLWTALLWLLGGVFALVVVFLLWALWAARASRPAPLLPTGVEPDPARDRDEAMDRLKRLNGLDKAKFDLREDQFNEACASVLIEPETGRDPEPKGTIVYFHGYTNCPAQFTEAAAQLPALGWRVLSARAPLHGEKDVLTRDLGKVGAVDLIDHVNATMDVAAGLSGPIYVTGLSGGGVLCAYAAATRREVDGVLCMAPTTVPMGMPLIVARLFVGEPWTMPHFFLWWDPRKRADLGESPYVYPGFPFPGIGPYLHIGRALWMGQVEPNHELEFANLQLNPNDIAVRKDAGRRMMSIFADHARSADEIVLTRRLGWSHDFIDQHGSHCATPEQVVEIVLYGVDRSEAAAADHLVAYREPMAAGLARGNGLDTAALDADAAAAESKRR